MSDFGKFINGNEYQITRLELPRPMLNYIWNARVLSGVNHLGGGNGAYGARGLPISTPRGAGALRSSATATGIFT